MTSDDTVPPAQDADQPQPGEVTQRLKLLTTRRFRREWWHSATEVAAVTRFADDQITLLRGEIERGGREIRGLLNQIEMLRHGSLPSTAPQGADPVAVALTMRVQEEANRTISDANEEGTEILAEARRQAEDILTLAHQQASRTTTHNDPRVAELEQKVKDLQARHQAMVDATWNAHQNLSQWQSRLSEQAEQLRTSAQALGKVSDNIGQTVKEQ
ncbi:hypothetical protein [Salinispora oceanensis]|uniref:hypothetical protein n=1 Tax=Salinispora oceanensis TaxID=1050199 RepID=UPI000377902E|nr:hypothetical protein [Salinispora oceanensis]